MITSKTCKIEHNKLRKQDQLLILDTSLLALFFFKDNKYILYNYIQQKIVSQISLTQDTHYAILLQSSQYILTLVPFSQTINIIVPTTGEIFKTIQYQEIKHFIPQIRLLGKNNFAILHNSETSDKRLDIYINFILIQRVSCCGVVEQYNSNSLISYTQSQTDNLCFTVITPGNQKLYNLQYNMVNKLIMKIIQHTENQILIVYTQKQGTHFMILTISQQTLSHFFQLKNRRFLDLIIYDKKRQLYISFLWQDWLNPENIEPQNIAVVQKRKNSDNKITIQGINVRNGCISKVYNKDQTYRFACYKYQKQNLISEVQVFMATSIRNNTINLMYRKGIIDRFGECIVKKVLSLIDY